MEKDYVFRYADWEWVPGALDGLRKFMGMGFRLVVVSNQSGVARGYYGVSDVQILHDRVAKELETEGLHVSGFYFCPHGPADACACRKPKPGLILQAEKELGIDLTRSYMVGDKKVDIEAGWAAGVKPILVATGYGNQEKACLPDVVPFVANVGAAADWVANKS